MLIPVRFGFRYQQNWNVQINDPHALYIIVSCCLSHAVIKVFNEKFLFKFGIVLPLTLLEQSLNRHWRRCAFDKEWLVCYSPFWYHNVYTTIQEQLIQFLKWFLCRSGFVFLNQIWNLMTIFFPFRSHQNKSNILPMHLYFLRLCCCADKTIKYWNSFFENW